MDNLKEDINSKADSGSVDEPLVPDTINDVFYKDLIAKITEIIKGQRQANNIANADDLQRLIICCNRFQDSMKSLHQKTEELREHIQQLSMDLESQQKDNQFNQNVIEELRQVVETTWRQTDAAHIREQVAQDELSVYKETVEQQEQLITTLTKTKSSFKQKQDITKEIEKLQQEIHDLKKRLQMQRNYTSEFEEANQALEEKNKNLIKILEETSSEAYQSKKSLDVLNKELEQIKNTEDINMEQIATLQKKCETLTKLKVKQNLQILSLKTNIEHLNTQYNGACNKLAKFTIDLEITQQERDRHKRDLSQKLNLLKLRDEEIIKWRQDNSKLNTLQETISRKHYSLQEAKKQFEHETLRLKIQLNTQEKQLVAMRKVMQQIDRNNISLVKERDTLKRERMLAMKHYDDSQQVIQELQHEIRSLKNSLLVQERKYRKVLDELMQVNNEKTKKLEEVQNLQNKIDILQNKIHLKEGYEVELKRTISDLEEEKTKLLTQQNAYTKENGTLQRSNQTLLEEKNKLTVNVESLENEIENLKATLAIRKADISRLQLQIDKLEKDRRLLKGNLHKMQLGRQQIKNEVEEMKKENDRNAKSQQEEQKVLLRFKKDYNTLLNEKNAICVALSHKEDKYNELKLQTEDLEKSRIQLLNEINANQEDLKLMRTQIRNLLTEKQVLRKDREMAVDTRQHLLQLHRQLNQERIKARAFRDEMLTPMNIHRWRCLHGRDPKKIELIKKLQTLRKLLLNQHAYSQQQKRIISETQYLYEALKEFLTKLPSINIKAEMNAIKSNLKLKDRKVKSLLAEMKAKVIDEKTTALEIDNLKGSVAKTMKQLLNERKFKEQLLEERQIFLQMQMECLESADTTALHLVSDGNTNGVSKSAIN